MGTIIKSILSANGLEDHFTELHTNGLANRIFASDTVILRIPTDHQEAMNDARTEAVAAPIARYYGIKTPRLIRYDNSCTLLDRSYSLWERVPGKTLGEIQNKFELIQTWKSLGSELAKVHTRITECSDPENSLDSPDREYTKEEMLAYFTDSDSQARTLKSLIDAVFTKDTFNYEKCFVHGDVHDENVMCSPAGDFSALIDWGDAGWGDPAIDFYLIPLEGLCMVLEGYLETTGKPLDPAFANRLVLDKIWCYIEEHYHAKAIYENIRILFQKPPFINIYSQSNIYSKIINNEVVP